MKEFVLPSSIFLPSHASHWNMGQIRGLGVGDRVVGSDPGSHHTNGGEEIQSLGPTLSLRLYPGFLQPYHPPIALLYCHKSPDDGTTKQFYTYLDSMKLNLID